MATFFCINCGERMCNRDNKTGTWFGVCTKLGQDVWICPKCKTMFVFKRGSNELKSVYKLDNSWKEKAEKSKKSCGCIVVRDDKILLIQAKNDEGELFWAFPKGKHETGETDMETAMRETMEEVGLKVKIIDEEPIRVGHLIHDGAAFKKIFLFIAKPLNDKLEIQKREVEEAKWVPINEAGKYLGGYYRDAWGELLERLKLSF